jgi:hypothetical protein
MSCTRESNAVPSWRIATFPSRRGLSKYFEDRWVARACGGLAAPGAIGWHTTAGIVHRSRRRCFATLVRRIPTAAGLRRSLKPAAYFDRQNFSDLTHRQSLGWQGALAAVAPLSVPSMDCTRRDLVPQFSPARNGSAVSGAAMIAPRRGHHNDLHPACVVEYRPSSSLSFFLICTVG